MANTEIFNANHDYKLSSERPGTTRGLGFHRVPTLTKPNWYLAGNGTYTDEDTSNLTEDQLTTENGFITPYDWYAKNNSADPVRIGEYRDDNILRYNGQYWWCEDLHNWCLYKAVVHDGANTFNEITLYVWNGENDWVPVGDGWKFYDKNEQKKLGKFTQFQAKYLNDLMYHKGYSIKHTRGFIGHNGYKFTNGPLSVNIGIILNKHDKYTVNGNNFQTNRYGVNDAYKPVGPCHIPNLDEAKEFDNKTYIARTNPSNIYMIVGFRQDFVTANANNSEFSDWLSNPAKMFINKRCENILDAKKSVWEIYNHPEIQHNARAQKDIFCSPEPPKYKDNSTDYPDSLGIDDRKNGIKRPIPLNMITRSSGGDDDNLYINETAMQKIFELRFYNKERNEYIYVNPSNILGGTPINLYVSWLDLMMIFQNMRTTLKMKTIYYYSEDNNDDEGGPYTFEKWWESNKLLMERYFITLDRAMNIEIPGLTNDNSITDKALYNNWLNSHKDRVGTITDIDENKIFPIFFNDPINPNKYKVFYWKGWYEQFSYASSYCQAHYMDVEFSGEDENLTEEVTYYTTDETNAIYNYGSTFLSFLRTLHKSKKSFIDKYSAVLTTDDIDMNDNANGNPFLIPITSSPNKIIDTTLENSNIREGIPLSNPAVRRTPGGQIVLSTLLAWGGMHRMMGGPDVISENEIIDGGDDKATKYLNEQCKQWFGTGATKTINEHWLKEYADIQADENSTNGSIVLNSRLDAGYTFEQINKNEDNDMALSIFTYRPTINTTTSGENLDIAKKW